MSTRPYQISKTSYLKFEQCSKAFFFYSKWPGLRNSDQPDLQIAFSRGNRTGVVARLLYPGGIDVAELCDTTEDMIGKTRELLEAGEKILYEAAFVYEGLLVITDLFVRENGSSFAYEVKSAARVNEIHVKDACLQHFVISRCVPDLQDMFLVSINPDYVLGDVLDPESLFIKRSVKTQALEIAEYFKYQVNAAERILEQNTVPNIPVGRQCFKPYQCDFFAVCWKGLEGKNSLFHLPLFNREDLFRWHHQGFRQINDVPKDLIKDEALVKIRKAFVSGEPIVNREKINTFLKRVAEPVIAMDMEVLSTAIPQIKGRKPFEQLPFLVSFSDGSSERSFFADDITDEKSRHFAEFLVEAASAYKTVLVYDQSLERSVITKLLSKFPDLEFQLRELMSRMVDVFDVFLHLSYYHPEFRNSFSLKTVASVLCNKVYSTVTSGMEAMDQYEKYLQSDNPLEKEYLKTVLCDYCETDAKATVEVCQYLDDLLRKPETRY